MTAWSLFWHVVACGCAILTVAALALPVYLLWLFVLGLLSGGAARNRNG